MTLTVGSLHVALCWWSVRSRHQVRAGSSARMGSPMLAILSLDTTPPRDCNYCTLLAKAEHVTILPGLVT